MDAHFHEYLAAITGMHDVYGELGDDHPSEFHQPSGVHQAADSSRAEAPQAAAASGLS